MLVQYLAAGAWEGAAELKINDMKEEKWIRMDRFYLMFLVQVLINDHCQLERSSPPGPPVISFIINGLVIIFNVESFLLSDLTWEQSHQQLQIGTSTAFAFNPLTCTLCAAAALL